MTVLGALEYAKDPECIKNRILRRTYGINLWMPTDWFPTNGHQTKYKKFVRYMPYTLNKKKPVRKPCLYAFVPYARMGEEVLIGQDVWVPSGKVAPENAKSPEVTVYVASCMMDVLEIVPWCSVPEDLRGEEIPYSLPVQSGKTVMRVGLNFGVLDLSVKLRTEEHQKVEAYDVMTGT
jgi:hypothetical protein